MGRSAVAVLASRAINPAAPDPSHANSGAQISSLRKQLGYGRRFRPGRSHLALLAIVVVGAWVVVGFGRTITSMNAATDRQAALTVETQQLNAQLDAGERELELVQTDGFQAQQARAYGIGRPGEIAFALSADAPPAPHIVPLGEATTAAEAGSPLEAWLLLLFGP
jgi:cell division protein FtsB